ncbi:MAG: recombinase family protein [Terriglobia bacterium]
MPERLEHGNTLIVWKLDRLGRSLRDLIAMLGDLRARGVKLRYVADLLSVSRSTLYRVLARVSHRRQNNNISRECRFYAAIIRHGRAVEIISRQIACFYLCDT